MVSWVFHRSFCVLCISGVISHMRIDWSSVMHSNHRRTRQPRQFCEQPLYRRAHPKRVQEREGIISVFTDTDNGARQITQHRVQGTQVRESYPTMRTHPRQARFFFLPHGNRENPELPRVIIPRHTTTRPTFTSSYLSDTQPSTTIGVYRGATQSTAKMPERDVDVLDEFISSYLQRLTTELSEDLDRVRNADDFRADSVPFLVHALVQGNYQFSRDDKERIVQASEEQKKEQKNMR